MSPPAKRPAARRKKRRRSKDKGPLWRNLEFFALLPFLHLIRMLPLGACRALAALGAEGVLLLVPRRRRIAMTNLEIAFPEMPETERRRIVRASCRSFILTGLEGIKYLRGFDAARGREEARRMVEGLDALLQRARRIHEESGGCIFVTPHLGNWELLAHASALAGIPLTVTVRPLDNPRLERRLFGLRARSGQQILSKRNAFGALREALRKGRSVAILADQHAGVRGVDVPFFGKPASTTIAPATLALHFGRPIVVVACLRREGGGYEALVGEPIRPDPEAGARGEIERLTAALTREIEDIVRKHPEQYLWMHDRWKLEKLWGRSEVFKKGEPPKGGLAP